MPRFQPLERMDAAGDSAVALFLERELTHVYTEVLRQEIAPPNALRGGMEIATAVPEWAKDFEIRTQDGFGETRAIANYADDLPVISIARQAHKQPVMTLGNRYLYSDEDIMAAMANNVPLTTELGITSRESSEAKVNQIAFFGDADFGIPGLLANADIPRKGLAISITDASDPDAVIALFGDLIDTVVTTSKGAVQQQGMRVSMPLAEWGVIQRLRVTDTGVSVYRYLQTTYPGVTFEAMYELGPDSIEGRTGSYIVVTAPMAYRLEIPAGMTWKQYPARQVGAFSFEVPHKAKCGGIHPLRPLRSIIGELP